MRRSWTLSAFYIALALLGSSGVVGQPGFAGQEAGKEAGKDDVEENKVEEVVEILSRSSTGLVLLNRARDQWVEGLNSGDSKKDWPGWSNFIHFGAESKTDAVLIRKVDSATGEETRVRQVSISLKADQSRIDQILDLGHELTHAVAPPAWDPYDPTLSPERYVFLGIEGPGGEVKAVIHECQIARELAQKSSKFLQGFKERCEDYGTLQVSVDEEKIRQDFYKMGTQYDAFVKAVKGAKSTFPLLSRSRAKLYSSTGKAPYPLALLQEYYALTEVACENSKKRLDALATSSSGPNRSPAGILARELIKSRCQ